MQNIGQYMPFLLIVLGLISITICAFMICNPLGFLIIGISLFVLAYILVPKEANP